MLPESRPLSLAVEVEITDGVAVVRLGGDLDFLVRDTLAQQLAEVAEKEPDLLVFDLAAVTFLDCGTAALMVRIARLLPSGRKPVVRSACPLARKVLQLTGLDTHCELAA